MEGVRQFLQAAGFQLKSIPNAQQEPEDFWVLSNTQQDHVEYLSVKALILLIRFKY
jgi:hypothetical protein